ncbi:hypothetical protein SAMN05421736_108144 [Evansella caseinilytica]|uniref:Uncharacterized protein n=1 Tax=Evansella caseinilytica TaxID=1503961 RepID=A0A1H3RL69_9BACI|nr:hypothetical protein [Evansella caseinilytica]SDZ25991.1 hypothetical protein SAMN05421736_108144 [Evansella caseinilytica]
MIIVGTFLQSIELEQTLAFLEKQVISKEQILVIFMDDPPLSKQSLGRTRNIHSNAFEVGMASATGSAVIGASTGFVLHWGPILWGLIAAIIGFTVGYGIYYFVKKSHYLSSKRKRIPEVTVIIQCTKSEANQIKAILWKNHALTVGNDAGD